VLQEQFRDANAAVAGGWEPEGLDASDAEAPAEAAEDEPSPDGLPNGQIDLGNCQTLERQINEAFAIAGGPDKVPPIPTSAVFLRDLLQHIRDLQEELSIEACPSSTGRQAQSSLPEVHTTAPEIDLGDGWSISTDGMSDPVVEDPAGEVYDLSGAGGALYLAIRNLQAKQDTLSRQSQGIIEALHGEIRDLQAQLNAATATLTGLRIDIAAERAHTEDAEAQLADAKALVAEQTLDEGLWAVPLDRLQSISEAHLQQELRRLHGVIEGEAVRRADTEGETT